MFVTRLVAIYRGMGTSITLTAAQAGGVVLAFACSAFAQTAPTSPARHATLPSVSPNGKRIAFLSDRDGASSQVYTVSTGGGDAVRVTQSPDRKRPPSWTHDGKSVLYASDSGDTTSVWAIDPSGGAPRRIAAELSKSITFSNDGRRIAYTVGSWTSNRILVAAADGSGATAITDSTAGYFNLAWSPDDRRIAVTRRDPNGDLAVWTMNADGSGARALTHFDPADGRPQWPAWSPDCRKIALQAGLYDRSDPAKSTAHIWVIDVATGKATKLAAHAKRWLDETPSWFPDGRRLAFQSTRTGAFEIWVMNADGSGARQVTR